MNSTEGVLLLEEILLISCLLHKMLYLGEKVHAGYLYGVSHVYIYACPSKYGVCLSCAYVDVRIAAYCKIKNDIFLNKWLVIELKAIKW